MAVRTAWTPTATAGELVSESDFRSIPGGWLGYAVVTSDQTVTNSSTETTLTNTSLTVTVGTNRLIRLSASGIISRTVADGIVICRFKESTTELGRWCQHNPSASTEFALATGFIVLSAPSAGSHTYHLTIQRFSGTGNVTLNAGSTSPATFVVEDIGPSS